MVGDTNAELEQDEASLVNHKVEENSAEGDNGQESADAGRQVDNDAKSENAGDDSAPAAKATLATPSTEPTTPGNSNGGEPQQAGTPATPGQVPIQPYGYPAAYPYYPVIPGYPPPPPSDPMLTGSSSNPYQYTDVSSLNDPVPDTRRNRGGVTEPFPEKLHRMLEQTELEGLTDVVAFFTHGRAFAIHKPRRFVTEIMPRFFKQTRLTSFQRQLNLYGFRRISQGPDNGGYYHELFLKGRSGLCVNMKRTKVKGSQKLKRDPDSEPNFYSYPPIKAQVPAVPPVGNHPQASPLSATSPGRSAASPQGTLYPGYGYPHPPYPVFPGVANAPPYTAAQQALNANAPMYPYPPYYAYPWFPGQPQPGQKPTPSPAKSTEPTSPEADNSAAATGATSSSELAATPSVTSV